jgi:hypothetical protein
LEFPGGQGNVENPGAEESCQATKPIIGIEPQITQIDTDFEEISESCLNMDW